MKKLSIICLCITALVLVYMGSYYFTIFNSGMNKSTDSESSTKVTIPVDSNQEPVITGVTKYVLECYDQDTKKKTSEVKNIPIEFVGMNRYNLIDYIKKYNLSPSAADKAKGLKSYNLMSFNKNEIVVRKTYSSKTLPKVYYIMAYDGKLSIYLEDKKTLYDNTDILLKDLPESVQTQIINGLRLDGVDLLYEFLQTYTS